MTDEPMNAQQVQAMQKQMAAMLRDVELRKFCIDKASACNVTPTDVIRLASEMHAFVTAGLQKD